MSYKDFLKGRAWIDRLTDWLIRTGICEDVEDALTADDVVEVVRCCKCKHFHRAALDSVDGLRPDFGICDRECFNSDEYDVAENDFCSMAERKDND